MRALRAGCHNKSAAAVAGISESTFYQYSRDYPDFAELANEARESSRQAALEAIQKAGEKEWRAHETWLRLAFPNEYRREGIHVTATANAGVIITPEDRNAIREQRERIMQQQKTPPLEQPKLQSS